MLESFRAVTAAIRHERVHFESFAPTAEASKRADSSFSSPLGREIFISPGQSILETLAEPDSRSIHPARKAFAACARRSDFGIPIIATQCFPSMNTPPTRA